MSFRDDMFRQKSGVSSLLLSRIQEKGVAVRAAVASRPLCEADQDQWTSFLLAMSMMQRRLQKIEAAELRLKEMSDCGPSNSKTSAKNMLADIHC